MIGNRIFISSSNIGSLKATSDSKIYYDVPKGIYSADGTQFLPDSFNWLNYHIQEPINTNTMTIGAPLTTDWSNINNTYYNKSFLGGGFYSKDLKSSTLSFTYLNTILNRRNGPYKWATWKQIRNTDNPLLKKKRQDCAITFLNNPVEKKVIRSGLFYNIRALRGEISEYTEPYITTKHSPLVHNFIDVNNPDNRLRIEHSFGNENTFFSNTELLDKTGLKNEENLAYNRLRSITVAKPGGDPPVFQRNLGSIDFKESVFPAAANAGLNTIRGRDSFNFAAYNSSRIARDPLNVYNSQGYLIADQSSFALDARNDYETAQCLTGGYGGEGELQNNYTTFYDDVTHVDPNIMGNRSENVIYFQGDEEQRTYDVMRGVLFNSSSWNGIIGNIDDFSISVWVCPDVDGKAYSGSSQMSGTWCIVSFGKDERMLYLTDTGSGANAYLMNVGFSASYNSSVPACNNNWVTTGRILTASQNFSSSSPETKRWTHIACVFDKNKAVDSRVTIYVNGVSASVTSPAAPSSVTLSTISLSVMNVGNNYCGGTGTGNNKKASPYHGYMSDLALWSGSLSQANVTEMYNNGVPYSLYLHSKKNNLISWWRLGSGIGLFSTCSYVDDFLDGAQLMGTGRLGTAFATSDRISPSALLYGTGSARCVRVSYKSANYAEPLSGIIKYFGDGKDVEGPEGALIGSYTLFSASTTCRIHDLIGNRHLYPVSLSSSDCWVPSSIHGFKCTADKNRITIPRWGSNFKVGALYARREPEYLDESKKWDVITVTNHLNETRYIRITGSRTWGGDTKWTAGDESGLAPFYDSYAVYSEEMKKVAKDYSIVPEFRISEHMDYYLNTVGGNFLADRDSFLTLTGSTLSASNEDNFFKTYSHSDFLQHFEIVKQDYDSVLKPSYMKLKCKALMKFIPYDGFFPYDRTIQLATLFSQSYGDYVKPGGISSSALASTASWRAFLTPYFAPGILYNSIKAGMAVDFPVYTDDYPRTYEDYDLDFGGLDYQHDGYYDYGVNVTYSGTRPYPTNYIPYWPFLSHRSIYGFPLSASSNMWVSEISGSPYGLKTTSSYNSYGIFPYESDFSASWKTVLCSKFSKRIDFEGLIEPESYLAKSKIWDMEPDYSASLRVQMSDPSTNQYAVWGGAGKLNYKLAMHNFLAEVPSLFLSNGKYTTFSSKPVTVSGLTIGKDKVNKFYGMDVVVNNSSCKNFTDWNRRKSLPQHEEVCKYYAKTTREDVNNIMGVHTEMYSRDSAFGPPWVAPNKMFTGSRSSTDSELTLVNRYYKEPDGFHYGYEPFTPAYQNGFGLARILFYPFKGEGNYTYEEIITHLTTSYYRAPTPRKGYNGTYINSSLMMWPMISIMDQNANVFVPTGSEYYLQYFDYANKSYWYAISSSEITDQSALYWGGRPLRYTDPVRTVYDFTSQIQEATTNWQQISSSINLFELTKVKNVTYEKGIVKDYEPTSIQDDDSTAQTVWIIQPKWETPIFNFHNKTLTSCSYGSGSLSRGMWHQYGDFCSGSEGIWLSVDDIPSITTTTNVMESEKVLLNNPIKENTLTLQKTNAFVDFIIEENSVGDLIVNIDGSRLWYGYDWGLLTVPTRFSASYELVAAITSSTLTTTWRTSNDPLSGAAIKEKFTAYAYIPEHNTASAAVRIEILDTATTSSWIKKLRGTKGVYDKITVDSNYPNYYASGKKGNDIWIKLEDDVGGSHNGPEILWSDTKTAYLLGKSSKGKLIKSNMVYFQSGSTPEYKVESLADLLGFPKTSKRMGIVADERTVREAVIAIPFYEESKIKKFFNVPRREIDLALGRRKLSVGESMPGQSIINMVQAMQRYVIPPKMDFINNDTIEPFAMYIFEFKHVFTKDDLKNIWQNLSPKVGSSFKTSEVIIEHNLVENEILNGNIDASLRWMVFKVKQKAKINYYETTADQKDDDRFKFTFNIGGKKQDVIPQYSYNWPYDYFSLVELVKLDTEIELGKK